MENKMNLTWIQLLNHIAVMDTEQQNSNVTIYNEDIDEFFPVKDIDFSREQDVLNENHPFLTIEG